MDFSVNVMQFAEARATEIASLMHEVNSSDNKKKTWFQRLPHYMRRRGASQNPKRVPRKLLEKRPQQSEKKRKRWHKKRQDTDTPKTATKHSWLETHIWHAKRFKMEHHWGYQLPMHSTDKKLGTCHKAASNRCMILDLSYYCCIELKGFQDQLISKLSCLSNASCGHTFASEMFLDGAKEGHCFLYHPHSYPFEALGPVSFLWEPQPGSYDTSNINRHDSELRKLWIWCHPSLHDELAQVLIGTLDLSKNSSSCENIRFAFPCKQNHKKTEPHFQREECYNNSSTKTEMNLLRNTLARHRLIGPLSLQVLSRALRTSDLFRSPLMEISNTEQDRRTAEPEGICDNGASDKDNSHWWKSYYQCDGRKHEHNLQYDLWSDMKEVQSSHYIPPKCVIGLTVQDPRSISNRARECSTVSEHIGIHQPIFNHTHVERFPHGVAASPLWERDCRHAVTAGKLPEHLINEERSKFIVTLDFSEKENMIPVIIVRQPDLNGFGSSFDLIAPLGWSLEFWRSYERNGALPAGLRDLRFVNLEAGQPNFPFSFPDTAASKKAGEASKSQSLSDLKRHPKSQRPNFSALGIPSPFFTDWSILVKEWEGTVSRLSKVFGFDHLLNTYDNTDVAKGDTEKYFVLRRMDGLNQLRNSANRVLAFSRNKPEDMKAIFHSFSVDYFKTQMLDKSLILVKIKCLNKGSPLTHAGLYMLSQGDMVDLKNNPKFGGPTEPNHSEEKSASQSKSEETPKSLIGSSSRCMIGSLSEGGFSGICGSGIGIGHCTSVGFLDMLVQCALHQLRPVVLYRNQHSFQFRVASIEII